MQTVILEEGAELKDIKQPMEAPIGWSDIWPWLVRNYSIDPYYFLDLKSMCSIKKKE